MAAVLRIDGVDWGCVTRVNKTKQRRILYTQETVEDDLGQDVCDGGREK